MRRKLSSLMILAGLSLLAIMGARAAREDRVAADSCYEKVGPAVPTVCQ